MAAQLVAAFICASAGAQDANRPTAAATHPHFDGHPLAARCATADLETSPVSATSLERLRRAGRLQDSEVVPVTLNLGNHGARVAGVPIDQYCQSATRQPRSAGLRPGDQANFR